MGRRVAKRVPWYSRNWEAMLIIIPVSAIVAVVAVFTTQ